VTTPWQRNLRLFVAYRAGTSLLVYIAISLPFYQSLGLDLGQIGWLYAINGLTVFAFDIPTGFIADRIGYRRMMIAGVAVQAVGFGLLALTYWQWTVFGLQVVLGLGQAIARGADGPLARKSANNSGVEFAPYSRRGVTAMGFSEAVASLVALVLILLLQDSAPRVAIGLQALIYVAVLYIPWRMHEVLPVRSDASVKTSIWSTAAFVYRHLRELVHTVRDELTVNKEARWLLLYGATIGCTTQTVVNLVQPYFQQLHLETWEFVLWWAGYHALWAVFSWISGWYERLLGRWGALASLVGWGIATNAAMVLAGGYAGLLVMVVFYFIRGIQMPIILDYTTNVVPEGRQATLMGVQTSVQFAMYSVMNIVLGYVAEHISVQAAFGVSLGVYGALGLVFIWLLGLSRR
jgi:MFS family permease